jgi:hypothetical protein
MFMRIQNGDIFASPNHRDERLATNGSILNAPVITFANGSV